MPWLHGMAWSGTGAAGDVITRRYKDKAAYLRRSLTEAQLSTIYRHLTDSTDPSDSGMLLIGSGGRVRAVRPQDTAVAQRDVVMKAVYYTAWEGQADDAANLAWIRASYRDVYADTGGVPVPGEVSDGSYLNYADVDLADPAWNTSGVPWQGRGERGRVGRLLPPSMIALTCGNNAVAPWRSVPGGLLKGL
ncbi:hypothetical protein ABT168_01700 [Streptomyces sp. NPDC001793]|uniref:hypothetical protein n=1 Tax=Streptomyces sp. NPDC001793 TaxID=3154657 RepID=UPI00332761AA